jgi:hypothetical protein
MISASVPETRARYASLTVEEALEKLREASETIESRGGVKPHEGRRVEEASQLITTSPLRSGSKTAERQQCYQQFLINVEKLCGIEMVILCAVGLGKSAVAAMKDRVRLRLPSRIKPQTDSLGHSILRKLVDEYSAKVRSTSTVGSSFESLSEETRTVAETQTPAQAPAPERESEPDARQTEQAGTRSETVHSGRRKLEDLTIHKTLVTICFRNSIHVLESTDKRDKPLRQSTLQCSPGKQTMGNRKEASRINNRLLDHTNS